MTDYTKPLTPVKLFAPVALWILVLGSIAAWLTHVFVCLNEDRFGFLIAGALFIPVAVIHGVGIWFGVWH